ncbi:MULTISPECIES: FAD-binding oxidoreductase [unclassified Mesorhizobium]|uniref:NAD(P)/FAD-dependent oxidoreductase n=2 Tax=Mesorhizobium TaxID=68287 RepID=UPI000FCC20B3|nr:MULTISPECIES: FAD-binding oxidoreductase [unclassified Mesorhizobium]RUT89617.1 FAD-binding oxidoreductase [Mesorhizobium sp. M7A.T.Ca.US.000.02.1.1]RUU03829.1 FAD-binding oxidoreductase [Mesorhizobium sp. M7A.T.Ca.TU.009.02.1.1]RUU87460.1 FAD-binding oxidoreductase [Mesorhizobium sp. M7A.T.Ca.TU.009.01.1.2]
MSSNGSHGGSDSRHIAVIGCGIIGCSAAFHLLRSGVRRVTVIDAGQPGAATTSAGAGFVSHWSAGMIPLGEEGLQLQQYGLDFYRRLHEVGVEIGYRPNGTLIMALTEDGRERFVRPVLDSPYAPPEMQDLNAAQIGQKMQGLIDPARVHSAAYNPHGIQLDTKLAMGVLTGQISELGGVFRSGTRVTAVHDAGDRVTIETDQGSLEADGVIVAAGAWNNQVISGLGWKLPLLRVVATRIVTDDRGLPSTIPTVQCRELRLWLRETFGAVMWGTGRHYKPLYKTDDNEIEPGQPHNIELMRETSEQELAELQTVFPPLRGSTIASWAQGVPCYTPDNGLVVGKVPGSDNVVVVGGDNESGVTHGPGLGRLSCELVLGHTPFVSAERFRVDRYASDAFKSEAEIEAAMPAWGARHEASRFGREA